LQCSSTVKLIAAWALLKETFAAWSEDKVPRLGAALAYYTTFSLAPLLLIVVGVAALVFGEEAAQGRIVEQISGLVGEKGAEAIQAMLQSASEETSSGVVAAIVGVVALLFGASGVFGELQDALNTIWGVKPKPGRAILGAIKDRFFSFAMVLAIAFLLLVSLVVTAALAAVGKFGSGLIPEAFLQALNLAVSLGVVTLLFAMIFKILPDVRIAWRDVWIGAFATAVLFTVGKSLIGLYLGKSAVGSAFGAAGSLVIVLVWIYYSAQILFLGAEITQVHARHYGTGVVPAADAVLVTAEARREQGLTPAPKAAAVNGGAWLPPAAAPAPATALAPVALAAGAVVAVLGFAAGRRSLRELARQAPEAMKTAATVTGAAVAVDRYLAERKRAA